MCLRVLIIPSSKCSLRKRKISDHAVLQRKTLVSVPSQPMSLRCGMKGSTVGTATLGSGVPLGLRSASRRIRRRRGLQDAATLERTHALGLHRALGLGGCWRS